MTFLSDGSAPPALLVRIDGMERSLSAARQPWRFGSTPASTLPVPPGAPELWFTLMFAAVWALRLHDERTEVWLDGTPMTGRLTVPLPRAGSAPCRIVLRREGVGVDIVLGDGAVGPADRRRTADTTPRPRPAPSAAPVPAPPPVPTPAPAPTPPRADGPRTRWHPRDDHEMTIGRSGTGADIELPGPNVARRHAVVRRTARGNVVLRDTSGHLGTYVNGRRMLVTTLAPGAGFTIGSHILEVGPEGELSTRALTPPDALTCHGLNARYRGADRPTLAGVDFSLPVGQVMAVIGPSGAGKSTLCRALLGEMAGADGEVRLAGRPLVANGSRPSHLVSFVPQTSGLHADLTARETLLMAARLRLARDLSPAGRAEHVDRVLRDLRLAQDGVADKPVAGLSGGQLRRVSIGLELLSDPALLILDEPTSGLDEGLDRDIMTLLRRFASSRGCAVVVVTHSMANLELADTVLAVTGDRDGGRVGYFGPPDGLCAAFGAAHHAEVMDRLRQGQVTSHRAPATARPARASGPRTDPAGSDGPRAHPARNTRHAKVGRTTALLTLREMKRLRARPYRLLQPLVLYPCLTVLLAGWAASPGLGGTPETNHSVPTALSVITICTAFFAMALSFSSVVGDRDLIEREIRWGVPARAAVVSKALVAAALTVLQAGLTLVGYAWWKNPPGTPALDSPLWPHAWSGPALTLPVLALASTGLGLLISATSRQLERVTFTLMGIVAVLVVLTGLLIPLGDTSAPGTALMSAVSFATPTRWGVAALGADVGLNRFQNRPPDAMWTHDASHVLVSCAALGLLALAFVAFASFVLTRQTRRRL
ncbi:ATP-binding cassette domain-containing protein [Streptomyces sp. NPDC005435]|uniref:ATP-binding cassette domain-containing protein n=1 Tax=Streptomyces sp. NPDC005435 TaxID=3154464 RepID=UPI00345359B3